MYNTWDKNAKIIKINISYIIATFPVIHCINANKLAIIIDNILRKLQSFIDFLYFLYNSSKNYL